MSDSATADELLPIGLALVTLVVRDYDEAIAWFTKCLRFTLVVLSDVGVVLILFRILKDEI